MRNNEQYLEFIEEDEKILYRCKVGKRFIILFVVLSCFFGLLAAIYLPLMIRALIRMSGTEQKFGFLSYLFVLLILVILAGLAIFFGFFANNLRNRIYVLTDKRILFAKGGILNNYRRMIDLKVINGVERKQNIVMLMLGVCSIDFFSPSIAMNQKKFLYLFTLSSSVFCFFGISDRDADEMMKLTLKNK